MALSESERQEWEAKFRREAAQELERKLKADTDPKGRPLHREDLEKEAELARLRLAIRDAYFEESGFVRHVDSRGVASWISPDDAAKKQAAERKPRRKPKTFEEKWGTNGEYRWIWWVGLVALAVVLGVFLAKP